MRTIKLHRRAEKGIQSLPTSDKRAVETAIERLIHLQANALLMDPKVQMLSNIGRSLFSYKVNHRLRMIFEVKQTGEILIQDIASHDVLRNYFNWERGI